MKRSPCIRIADNSFRAAKALRSAISLGVHTRLAGFKLAVVACSVILATLLTFPLASRMVHSRDLLFIFAITLVSRYSGALSGGVWPCFQ